MKRNTKAIYAYIMLFATAIIYVAELENWLGVFILWLGLSIISVAGVAGVFKEDST